MIIHFSKSDFINGVFDNNGNKKINVFSKKMIGCQFSNKLDNSNKK